MSIISNALKENPDLSIDEILKKHNVNLNDCMKITTLQHKTKKNQVKYIHRVHKHYKITKQDPETLKNVYYGTYRNMEEAKMVRDKLIEYNWDKNRLNEILTELGVERTTRKTGRYSL